MNKTLSSGDMTSGPLLIKLLRFSIPLMLTGILQLLYNAADLIVVGQHAGDTAIAAVGATGALINLIINLAIGLSAGTSVRVAYYCGAKDEESLSRVVHTSMLLSLICGLAFGVFGFSCSRLFLEWMDTPADVIGHSALYMRIYFAGLPATLIYNFGSAILRSTGDTRRPLIYLTISGAINVLLNLLFVFKFDMTVDGVALATVLSQVVSAAMVLFHLFRTGSAYRLILGKLRLDSQMVKEILRIGIPAGIQGMVFSASNVLIQSSINGFQKVVMAGNSAAGNVEGFVYTAMVSFHHAAMTFTSQNVGAGKMRRVGKVLTRSLLCVTVTGVVLGVGAFLLGKPLMAIYNPDSPAAIEAGCVRMMYVCLPYFLCGCMDVMSGAIRGLGSSVVPMIVSLLGACGFRVLWIFTVFAFFPELPVLYISYPISWALTFSVHLACYAVIKRRLTERIGLE